MTYSILTYDHVNSVSSRLFINRILKLSPSVSIGTSTRQKMMSLKRMEDRSPRVDDQEVVDSDEELHSSFEVHEIFQRVPLHILQDILGYLDIFEATKKSRVSKFWKESLASNPIRNKGIAVLQQPSKHNINLNFKLLSIMEDGRNWAKAFVVKRAYVTHLLTVGEVVSSYPLHLKAFCSEMAKVTFCKENFVSNTDYWDLPPTVTSVTFLDCSMKFYDCKLFLDMDLEYWRAAPAPPPWKRQRVMPGREPFAWWNWTMKISHMEVIKKSAHEPMNPTDLIRTLEERKLIWPYPDEQVQWLMSTLENLDEPELEAVTNAEEELEDAVESCDAWESMVYLELTTTAQTWNGRRLSVLDMAFLGRLLVAMDEHKELSLFEPPPFTFPDDFVLHVGPRA